MERKASPRDISDDEWALVAPYLPRITAEAPQRAHSWREVCKGLRWMVRAGAAWRVMPQDLPPWHTVYPQSQRWLQAGGLAAMVHARRALLRVAQGRHAPPAAAICESRPLQSTPDSGPRAGAAGAKRRRGSTVHMAVETVGPLLALRVTAANAQDRRQVGAWAAKGHEVTGDAVARTVVDQGDTGDPAAPAAAHHRSLDVVKRPEATPGLVLLPKRWGVERSNAGVARFRRVARDDAPLAETLAGWHVVAFALLMLKRCVAFILHTA